MERNLHGTSSLSWGPFVFVCFGGEVKEPLEEEDEGAEALEEDEDDKGTTESILLDFNHKLRSLLMERSRNLKARPKTIAGSFTLSL